VRFLFENVTCIVCSFYVHKQLKLALSSIIGLILGSRCSNKLINFRLDADWGWFVFGLFDLEGHTNEKAVALEISPLNELLIIIVI
jgi:hypothetical protein